MKDPVELYIKKKDVYAYILCICNIFLFLLYFLQVCIVYICYGAETVMRTHTWPWQWTTEILQPVPSLSFSLFFALIPPHPRLVFVVSLYVMAHNELVIASCHYCGCVKCYCTHHVNNTWGGEILANPDSWVASVLVIRLGSLTNRQIWVYTVCICVYTELLCKVYKSSNRSTGNSVGCHHYVGNSTYQVRV